MCSLGHSDLLLVIGFVLDAKERGADIKDSAVLQALTVQWEE